MSDRRGAFLVCPACSGAMVSLRLHDVGVIVQRCDGCMGVWFDWFDGETSGLSRSVPWVDGGSTRAHGGGVCPRDGASLVTQPYLDAGPPVPRCPTCLGLFASPPQIEALQWFHEHMPDSPEPIERTSLLDRLWHTFAH